MKKLITLLTILPVLLALLLAGCSPDDPSHPTIVAPTGTQLFANYVAMGNSLTSGFMDSGLSVDGQINSYPRLISKQIGFSGFTQPRVSLPGVGSTTHPTPGMIYGVLHWNPNLGTIMPLGQAHLEDVINPATGYLQDLTQPTPYHNLGVPGALLHDVMNAYDAASSVRSVPFFDFINRASFFGNSEVPAVPDLSPAYQSASMFAQTVAKGSSLVTLWIGNNDILGSATSGTDQGMTPANVFQAEYTALVGTLAGGLLQRTGFPATIVLANIPSITSIPYFITEATFEAAIEGSWPWGYEESNVSLLTFTALSWASDAANLGSPVPANYTLTTSEVTNIETAVATYNGIIDGVAAAVTASGYASVGVVDANAAMTGLTVPEKTHFMLLLPQTMGNIEAAAAMTRFSLDGVHPNNHGYGIIANLFIAKINEMLGTEVPEVDLASLVWDPTYGVEVIVPAKTASPVLSPAVAEAMTAIFK